MKTSPAPGTAGRTGSLRRATGLAGPAAILLAGLLLAGCGAPSTPAGPATAGPSSGASAPASSGAAAAGSVQVQTLGGASLTIPTGHPTVLYFFTASCGSCVAGAKAVAAGLAKAAPGAQAMAVDLDPGEPTETLTAFMSSIGNPPLTFTRDDGTLLKKFNVDALGLTVVLNGAGKEVYRGVDPSADQIAQALAAAGS
ncbi:TlpA family protein disulfide reductase [Micrococcaceae bacterium Sec5.7]